MLSFTCPGFDEGSPGHRSNGEGHLPASWNSPSGWFLFCPFETANQTNTPNGIWVSQRGCHVKAWQEEGDQLGCCPWRACKKEGARVRLSFGDSHNGTRSQKPPRMGESQKHLWLPPPQPNPCPQRAPGCFSTLRAYSRLPALGERTALHGWSGLLSGQDIRWQ